MQSQIQPTNQGIVRPAIDAQGAIDAWKEYQLLKVAIVDEKDDIQLIQGKKFLKKSYWRKVATFFNLTTEVVEERKEQIGKTIVWHFTMKATAPNGRSAIGTGSCDAFEKATKVGSEYMQKGRVTKWGKSDNGKSFPLEFEWTEAQPNSLHNIRSTAETRATNRAISNLVGGGEVSAEEVAQNVVIEESKPAKKLTKTELEHEKELDKWAASTESKGATA